MRAKYFFKAVTLLTKPILDLALEIFEAHLQRSTAAAIRKRQSGSDIRHFTVLNGKLTLAEAYNRGHARAVFQKDDSIFTTLKRRHSCNVQDDVTNSAAYRRDIHDPAGLAFDRFLDINGVGRENQSAV